MTPLWRYYCVTRYLLFVVVVKEKLRDALCNVILGIVAIIGTIESAKKKKNQRSGQMKENVQKLFNLARKDHAAERVLSLYSPRSPAGRPRDSHTTSIFIIVIIIFQIGLRRFWKLFSPPASLLL